MEVAAGLFGLSILLGSQLRPLPPDPDQSREVGPLRNVILAIDLGSSSIRCAGYQYDLQTDPRSPKIRLLEGSVRQIKKKSIQNGTGNAQEIFEDVTHVVDECLAALRKRGVISIDAVSMASFSMNFVGVDSNGEPVTKVFNYASEFHETFATIDGDVLREHTARTGTFMHHPSFAPQHFHLMSQEETRALKWQSLSCFIFGRWTGLHHKFPISPSEAAWMGLLNVHRKQWDESALKYSDVTADSLPPIFSGDEGISTVSTNFLRAAHWPELESALFIPGIADGLAANIASKCYHPSLLLSHSSSFTTPGRYCVAVTIGTSAAVRIVLPFDPNLIRRLTSPGCGLWVYRVSQSEVIAGGSLTDGGSLADWLSQFLGTDRLQEITTELEELYQTGTLLSLASTLPIVLPFWSGERSTGWNQDTKGAILGLSHQVTPALLLYSLMEGVMVRIQVMLSTLLAALQESREEEALPDPSIVVSGSSLEKHWVWRQILADILDKQVLFLKSDSHSDERTLHGVSEYIVDNLCRGESGVRRVWEGHEIERIHSPDQGDYRTFFDQRIEKARGSYEQLDGGLQIRG
jgi:gluconokinase